MNLSLGLRPGKFSYYLFYPLLDNDLLCFYLRVYCSLCLSRYESRKVPQSIQNRSTLMGRMWV